MFSLIRDVVKTVGTIAGGITRLVVATPVHVVESMINGGNEAKVADAIFNGCTGVGEFVGEVAGEVVVHIPSAIARELVSVITFPTNHSNLYPIGSVDYGLHLIFAQTEGCSVRVKHLMNSY